MDVKIVMLKTNGRQKEIPLKGTTTVLGRGKDCDIRIPIESCSRKQCELRIEGNQLQLKDLGSSNGTFLNNVQVEEATLKAGDKLTIGPVVLTIQIDGQPETASPTQPTTDDQTAQKNKEPVSLADDSSPGHVADPGAATSIGRETAVDDDPLSALEALGNSQDKDKDK